MNEKWKKWLIAALCLIAVGVICIVIAEKRGTTAVDGPRTGIGIIDGFHIRIEGPWEIGWGSSGTSKHETTAFTAEETASVKELDVCWNAGELEFSEWDNDYIEARVEYSDESFKPTFTIEDGIFKVETRDEHPVSIGIGTDNGTYRCEIYMPDGFSVKRAGMKMNAGRFEMSEGLRSTETLDLELNAGHMDVESINIEKECRIEVNAGELEMQEMTSHESTRISVNAGKADIEGAFGGDVRAEVNAGALVFSSSEPLSETSVDMTVNAGAAEINGHQCAGMNRCYVDKATDRPNSFTAHVNAGSLIASYEE